MSRTIEIPNELLIPKIKEAVDAGHTVTFRVKGKSMRLFLEDGRDKVILAPVKAELRRGDVVLAEIAPGHYVLHRIIRREGDLLTLKGDGNVRGTEVCRTDKVVGIATGFLRKGRTQPDRTDGRKWRLYSHIWLALSPLRRLILGVYRRQPFRV
ncbi:MAG: S24/S26 family peptidase [Alloprevotella sp.]